MPKRKDWKPLAFLIGCAVSGSILAIVYRLVIP
jgi:hypothetical protein